MEDFTPWLRATDVIDFDRPAVAAKARELADGWSDPVAVAERCFVFVREQIAHSDDAGHSIVTCAASEALEHRTGACYAKSHLLAALLRANQIPTAICYQRLSVDDIGPPFCLHALNAAFLPGFGWYRFDARGNKPGVDARFAPPVERLAFVPKLDGEYDLPDRYADPLPEVVEALGNHRNCVDLFAALPDLPG